MSNDSMLDQATAILGRLTPEELELAAAWLARLESGQGVAAGPIGRLLAMNFTTWKDGVCSAEIEVGPEFWNPVGVLHGSVTHALIDTTMGGAVVSALGTGKRQSTIELKVSYLRPVKEGRITAESRVTRQGKRIWFLDSQVTDESGELVATGSASYYVP
jgi:uncharacterized protein (TIGR00369 family)